MALARDTRDKLVNAGFATVWIGFGAWDLLDGADFHGVASSVVGLSAVALWERDRRRQRRLAADEELAAS